MIANTGIINKHIPIIIIDVTKIEAASPHISVLTTVNELVVVVVVGVGVGVGAVVVGVGVGALAAVVAVRFTHV